MKPIAADYDIGLVFLQKFCKKNFFFNGGDVLAAWRKTEDTSAQKNWRNVWSAVLARGEAKGWMQRVGRASPTSPQSHTLTLTVYESRLKKKPAGYQPPEMAASRINDLVSRFRMGEFKAHDLAWKAFALGAETQLGG